MLKSLSIKNFRQFCDIKIEPLKRVNLIAGKNNSGKTALLEALYLLFAQGDAIGKFPYVFRSDHGGLDNFVSFWRWLPYQHDLKKQVVISALNLENQAYSVAIDATSSEEQIVFEYFGLGRSSDNRLRINKAGSYSSLSFPAWPQISAFSTRPSLPTEDAEQFNRIAAKRGGRQKLLRLLQAIEPRLYDLQYLRLGHEPLVYADIGMEDLIPITQLGHGFIRFLKILAEALLAESQIILIDEIENGLSYRAQVDLWRGLAVHTSGDNIQIFATTHSYECIQAAHEVFSQQPQYDFALHRLERTHNDGVRVITYDQETLATSIDLDFEVR